MTSAAFPQDERLRQLMAQANISSYRALSQRAGVSRSTVNQLRQGRIGNMRLETLYRLSQALGQSVSEFLACFGASAQAINTSSSEGSSCSLALSVPGFLGTQSDQPDQGEHAETSSESATVATLRREYAQLQDQLSHQEQTIRQQVQRQALAVMEPWLLMWPNAVQAAEQKPDLLACKVIPLTRPLQELLQTWAVRPIGTLGAVVPYDPQVHQPRAGHLQPGQTVQISRLGYWHGDHLIHRAEVVAATEAAP